MLFQQVFSVYRYNLPSCIWKTINSYKSFSIGSNVQKFHSGYYEITGFPEDCILDNETGNVFKNEKYYYCYGVNFENSQNTVISITGDDINASILIEECMFNSISSTENGGAIRFECLGQIHQNRVCSIKCSSRLGNHAYIISSSGNAKHSIFETTISETFNTNPSNSLWMQNDINIKTTNFSKLIMPKYSAFILNNFTRAKVQFCTIANNVASSSVQTSVIIYCSDYNGVDLEVEFTNIIGNIYEEYGARLQCNAIFTRCAIYSNTARVGKESGFLGLRLKGKQ